MSALFAYTAFSGLTELTAVELKSYIDRLPASPEPALEAMVVEEGQPAPSPHPEDDVPMENAPETTS